MPRMVPIFHALVSSDGSRLQMLETERNQRQRHLQTLAGQRVEVVVRRVRTKISLDQQGYLFAVPFAILAEEWGEDIETTKLLVLGECFGWKETRDGHRMPVKPSLSNLTTEETSLLIEWIPPWALLQFGVNVPLPKKAEAA